LVNCISDAVDLINHRIIRHHKRVAYIALSIARELSFSEDKMSDLMLSGLLHDIGAFAATQTENSDLLRFDVEKPHGHAISGALLLQQFKQFSSIASIIHFHHVAWDHGNGSCFQEHEVPILSHVIHLADRIDILMKQDINILDQIPEILANIKSKTGSLFHPDLVDGFFELSKKESFWLDVTSPQIKEILAEIHTLPTIRVSSDELTTIANLIGHIIDFRSPFTATHSSGVAATAYVLGDLFGMTPHQLNLIKIAGFLHDIGKLAVPREILEKPAPLTETEFNVVKKHAYYTKRILDNVTFLSQASEWASSHHEHLSGSGYPFHYSEHRLDLGSRIIAVADIFTALLENRPYRLGMQKNTVIEILQKCVVDDICDHSVVGLLLKHFDQINDHRIQAQQQATIAYKEFWEKTTLAYRKEH
jgi:putative nucleotidyltransferase with HDIG domain